MQFVRIERGRTAPDTFELEDPDYLFDIHFLAVVFWRPAEQTQIIAHRRREIPAPDVILHARAFVALAHLRAVAVQDERDVGVLRRRCAQRANDLDMLWRVRKMIFAADHVGDFHFQIVDHVDEVKDP